LTGVAGQLPLKLGQLTGLKFLVIYSTDSFTGFIPDGMCSLVNLAHLEFYKTSVYGKIATCSFKGSIPDCMGKLIKLNHLAFGSNKLTGPVPLEICELVNLQKLELDSNNFEGIFCRLIKRKHS
jgi:Leucine-rich repeat (LRR) protein